MSLPSPRRFLVLIQSHFLCPQVSRSGQNNSVFTLYELTNGEDTEDEGNAFPFPLSFI